MANNNLSRRDFLKGAAASAMGFAAMGVLGSATAFADGPYTPGTYTATADGIGKVTVTATFDATSITAVELDVGNETAAIGGAAKAELEAQILAAQGAEIDGVSGATITSGAVKKALSNCIAQAKGEVVAAAEAAVVAATDGSFVLTDIIPEDIMASAVVLDEITNIAEEIDVDIVVCGAGASGVVAACYAADQGAKVALLQKEAFADSQGNCASAIIKGESTVGGLRAWRNMAIATNAWRADPRLLDAYIDHSEAALTYLMEAADLNEGNEYKNEKNNIAVYQWTGTGTFTGVRTDGTQVWDFGEEKCEIKAPWFGPKPQNFGTLVKGILKDAQERCGDKLDVHMSTPVVQLVKKDGKVVGCVGQDESGKFIKFNAKAVILATGAYENNKTMVRRFCPDAEAFDKKVYHRTGDGNILAIEAGGVMEPVAHSTVMHDFDAGLMWDEPTFVNVNMNGERFVNEVVEMAYISKQLRWQPGFKGANMDACNAETGSKGWYCQVYDDKYMEYAVGGVPSVVMERYMPEEAEEKHVSVFPNLIDTYKADTIAELAEKLGVPAENLEASIKRYNEMCDQQKDDDFGKDAKYLHKIETAPFWGIRRHIRCSSITAGVLTDANSMVVREDGSVIDGLYAVGNLGGQFFGGCDYPFFSPGMSLGHAVTFGYIAAKHAVENL